MELVIVSVGILLVLIGAAVVMDVKARRRRRRLSVDSGAVLDARRINHARSEQYGVGPNRHNDSYGGQF
jgi:hypothetical protein